MRIEATKFDSFLKADGGGAFSRIEYLNNNVLLRIATVKELTGVAHFYFGADRGQITTGRAFSSVPFAGGDVGYRLRFGSFYKFVTNVEVIKPLPEKVHADIEIIPDMYGSVYILPINFKPGFKGRIFFIGNVTRRTEMVEMFAFSQLVFRSPVVESEKVKAIKPKVRGKKSENIISAKQKSIKQG